ncbi:Glycosyltransferase involved in cell wall bisynthesis [Geopseudomonas sagittaria]|uniref:Glycosyltransferase involved in cell wall bisynthesis n=1 Tax=Geopseudomonas sagittaria TaxID=1135990 RepID=A0A1I5VUB8_9GAMM|nr:glycosyltransferase family 4 protein [Pseudomonas sagittaria]SFQ11089.1 Glycosyltransferase involved in cell wall bisynthesis [Pseudomonas sagittaria]
MNIIIPILGFGKAGGYRVLSKLANEFIKQGNSVTFVTPAYGKTPYYPTTAKIINTKSLFRDTPIIRVLFGIISIWLRILKMENGHVLANHNLTAYIAYALPKKFKKTYYVQAYEVNLMRSFLGKLVAYISYFLPVKKIVNSEKILPRYFHKISGTVPAGIDLELFYRESKIYDKSKKIRIGCIGRTERYKGTNEIIEAFSSIIKKYDVELNIAVHTPKIPDTIKDSTKSFSISSDKELSEFYDKNEIIVATGLIEDGAFHYPCAEGMASGKIVISNYSPLVEEQHKTHAQLQLRKITSSKIAKALEYAINMTADEQKLETEKNKEIISKYSWEIVSNEMIKIMKA